MTKLLLIPLRPPGCCPPQALMLPPVELSLAFSVPRSIFLFGKKYDHIYKCSSESLRKIGIKRLVHFGAKKIGMCICLSITHFLHELSEGRVLGEPELGTACTQLSLNLLYCIACNVQPPAWFSLPT